MSSAKVTATHVRRLACLYVRQSSLHQVHDHRESTVRQYALRQRAEALGWDAERITVIDDDLGLSGASAAERGGFQRLVADVGLGRVGLVLGLEVSRLARNSSDWHRLLEICALTDTLILDEDGLYDPAHFNDRLLLGLKGTMSEAELHILRARLLGGQLNKARRGELRLTPPLGFVNGPDGGLMIDPDEQIQRSVRLLFAAFRRLGSACGVVREFAAQGVPWPYHPRGCVDAAAVTTRPLDHRRIIQILHNPRYAGAYVFGRTRQRRVRVPGQPRCTRVPREQWHVFLPNMHPGYITWDEFEANQETLRRNAGARGAGLCGPRAPREGGALLQGLVLCGRCGRRMTVSYKTRQGRAWPRYYCQAGQPTHSCQTISGASVDAAIATLVLEAVTPAALDVALEVFDELQARRVEVDRLRRATVERAQEDVQLAQRQFMLVRPEHRLVADTLERNWNQALQRLAEAEETYERMSKAEAPSVTPETRERVHALVSDLPRLWHDPRTSPRDRKRILRLLIDDVTITRDTVVRLQVRWKGGATNVVECPRAMAAPELRRTPSVVIDEIRTLAATHPDGQIATRLNSRSLRTSMGLPFTARRVRSLRRLYAIPKYADHLRQAGWLTTTEIATRLGIHPETAKVFARQGLLRAVRAHGGDRRLILYEPVRDALPRAQPGKRLKDRQRYPQLPAQRPEGVQYDT